MNERRNDYINNNKMKKKIDYIIIMCISLARTFRVRSDKIPRVTIPYNFIALIGMNESWPVGIITV